MRAQLRRPAGVPTPARSASQALAAPGAALKSRFTHDFSRVPPHANATTIADRATRGSGESYPFREQIQRSFGRHDISPLRAHGGSAAAAAARDLNARAFTFGEHVAFEGRPDLHTAAHEAAHAVQQRAGVHLPSAVGRRGDVHERRADAAADRVVRNESAEELLDAIAPAGTHGVQRPVVQRAEKTKYGSFDTTRYNTLGAAGKEYGVDIELTFDPLPATVDARKIGLTQTVRTAEAGKSFAPHPSQQQRMAPAGIGEGRRIDRSPSGAYANPLYAAKAPGPADALGDTPTSASWGQHGWHYTEKGTIQHQIAKLIDKPTLGDVGREREQTFETAALAVEGSQAGTYMGSVEWGWRVDAAGKFTQIPLRKKSDDVPTSAFMAAAKQWNTSRSPGTIKTSASPTSVYDDALAPAFTVDKDTEVAISSSMQDNNVSYNEVEIKSGTETGRKGWIKTADLRDTGGGRATIPLPIQRVSTINSAADLKSFHDPASETVARLPDGTGVKVIREWGGWAEVEVDAKAAGIALGPLTKPDIAGMIHGYVPRETTR